MKKFAVLMMLPLFSMMMCSGRDVDPYAAVQKWYGDYDVKFYRLNIEASDTSANVKGCAEIVAGIVTDGLQQFTLELAARTEVYSVWVNGSVAMFKRDGDLLHAIPAGTLAAGTLCSVRICYAISESEDGGFFTAVSNSRVSEWDMPVTWTLSEPFNAKYWFPCKQYLPDKADSAYIFVTVPEHLKAGAPGVLSNVVRVPEGRMRYEWKTQYPVAYYLLSFAVADYADYTVYAYPKIDSTGKTARVSVHNYVYNRDEYISGNRKMMDTIASLIELYSELYIPYPFAREKYGHCVAPMGGGMEHQTMTTLSEFNFLLMAHELAHQWFGNLVTCASFQDVWINEGFASYSEYLALERLASPERAREWLEDTHAGATWSQNSGSVFVPAAHADDEWRIFDMSLSYKKGAALVHSIRRMVNDDSRFFDILRGFLRKYSFSVATGNDFRQYLESETGMDFTAFFDQWYFGEGFPIFDLSWKNGDGYTDILVEQHGSSQATPMFTVDLDVRISGTDGSDTIVQIPVRSIRNTFRFTASREASGMEIDPYYNVLKQVRNSMQVRDFPTDDTFVQCSPVVKRQEDLHVTLSAAAERNCSIKLTDAGGENVFVSVKAGRKQTVTVPMADLEYGIYLLYVKNGSNQYVRKIFKTPY